MAQRKSKDLLLRLEADSSTPSYQQIYEQIVDSIKSEVLVEGDKLPSTRKLAEALGTSHITTERAYQQLTVEGFVRSVPRSGYIVQGIDAEFLCRDAPDNEPIVSAIMQDMANSAHTTGAPLAHNATYDFSYYNLQPGSFPERLWSRLTNEVILETSHTELVSYPDQSQPNALQRALCAYLGRTRGVRCLPAQIILFPGSEQAIIALLQLFDVHRDTICHEEPGYSTFTDAVQRAGFSMLPTPTDSGSAAHYLSAIKACEPKLLFATPSHQYPTGKVMALETRIALLKLAREIGFYILEDDSCSEFRYGTSMVPSLQSLDADNKVIYFGNFSKVLSPSLRVAYMVLPPDLLRAYHRVFETSWSAVPFIIQEVLAKMIAKGDLDQHVRKMATSNARRHDELVRCLKHEFGDMITLSGIHAGMHLYAYIHNGMNQQELVSSALERDALVYRTDQCWFENPPDKNTLMIGFSAIAFENIEPGVKALAKAWL